MLITSLELAVSAVRGYLSALVSRFTFTKPTKDQMRSLRIVLPWLLVAEETFLHFVPGDFEAETRKPPRRQQKATTPMKSPGPGS